MANNHCEAWASIPLVAETVIQAELTPHNHVLNMTIHIAQKRITCTALSPLRLWVRQAQTQDKSNFI